MSDLIGPTVVVFIWALFWIGDRLNPAAYSAKAFAFWACWYGVLAIWSMVDREIAIMVTDGGFAAWCAYKAWKRRKPRQRKPSRVAGMVRDLGHRLVVTSS